MKKRIYKSNAARQAAYRKRKAAALAALKSRKTDMPIDRTNLERQRRWQSKLKAKAAKADKLEKRCRQLLARVAELEAALARRRPTV
jgi:hypothetical protein